MNEALKIRACEIARDHVRKMFKSYAFGAYTMEDLQSEACLIALQAIEDGSYDQNRDLAAFLCTHLRNRLLNLRRDKFRRSEPPCRLCHEHGYCDHGRPCKAYNDWEIRNNAKSSLAQASPANNSPRQRFYNIDGELLRREITRAIDALPACDRSTFLKMLSGVKVSKARRQRVEDFLREFMEYAA